MFDALGVKYIKIMAGRCAGSLLSFSRSNTSIFSRCSRVSSLRWMATATEATSQSTPPPPSPSPADPKISKIVDDISGLTLLQAADLVTLLKSRLNIQEIAMPVAAAPATSTAAAESEAPEEKPKERTSFNVKLESFDASAKAKVIKEVKALVANLTLIEAKKFVESLPQVLKENMPKEEAEKLKATLEGLGAVVKLE
ncbi:Ribosomal protein L7/L12 C-terminal domain containing protein [Amanita muscaria]